MKYSIVAVLYILLSFGTAIAQPKNIEYGPEFKEAGGFNKVLQLENGNTVLLSFKLPDFFEVRIYNSNRKEVAYHKHMDKLWSQKREAFKVLGVYEIAGEPTIFFRDWNKGPLVTRVIINNSTGDIKAVDILESFKQKNSSKIVPNGYQGPIIVRSSFVIEKDPFSDDYVLISQESNKKLPTLSFFSVKNGSHYLVKKVDYDGGVNKYAAFLGALYVRKGKLVICSYNSDMLVEVSDKNQGKPTSSKRIYGGDNAEYVMSIVDVANGTFLHKSLNMHSDIVLRDVPGQFARIRNIIKYNETNNTIHILTLLYRDSDKTSYYSTFITSIDGSSYEVLTSKKVSCDMVDKFVLNNFTDIKSYDGPVKDIIINDDNTVALLGEETKETMKIEYYSSGSRIYYRTSFGLAGITFLDRDGNEIDGFAINKDQKTYHRFEELYLNKYSKGRWNVNLDKKMQNYNQFLSYDYIKTPEHVYLIYNDYPQNLYNNTKKLDQVNAISVASTILCEYKNGKVSKTYLYAEPEGRSNTFSYTGAYSFLPKTKTYANVVIERNGKRKRAKMVWVSF